MINSSPSAGTASLKHRIGRQHSGPALTNFAGFVIAGLTLAACATVPPTPAGCTRGILTGEGASCQTLRDADDALFSFYADMTGYRLGEAVCLCGPPAQMSFCGQGTVIDVTHLGRDCPPAVE